MTTVTKFPVVLIHGLLGYGYERPLWNLGIPYWPEKELNEINPNYILVDVGTVTSDHDRACEAFYQIMGGTVDYGEEHARETGHRRYGATYDKPRHPNWSETNPIHIVGHSMGSTTAIELYQLLCDDAFGVGSNSKWVRSITCIAGPLTGSTISHVFGLHGDIMEPGTPVHYTSAALGAWFKLYTHVPFLRGFFDLRASQWANCPLKDLVAVDGPLNRSKDMAVYTCLPARRIERNSQLKHMDKVYLMSIATSPRDFHLPRQELACFVLMVILAVGKLPRWMPHWLRVRTARGVIVALLGYFLIKRVRALDYAKLPSLYAQTWLMRRRARSLHVIFDGFDPDHWEHNDGAVNIHSMLRPWFPKPQELGSNHSTGLRASSSSVSLRSSASAASLSNGTLSRCASHISIDAFHHEYDEEETSPPPRRFEKGRWYVYRVDCNHFAGTYGDGQAADLYKSLFTMMVQEYERDEQDEKNDEEEHDVAIKRSITGSKHPPSSSLSSLPHHGAPQSPTALYG